MRNRAWRSSSGVPPGGVDPAVSNEMTWPTVCVSPGCSGSRITRPGNSDSRSISVVVSSVMSSLVFRVSTKIHRHSEAMVLAALENHPRRLGGGRLRPQVRIDRLTGEHVVALIAQWIVDRRIADLPGTQIGWRGRLLCSCRVSDSDSRP